MSSFNFVKAVRQISMPPTTKLVAITLATYADYKTGECYPTVETLMEDTGLSNRAVCQHIRHIESMGILAVDRSNGRRSHYKFIAENLTKAVTDSHQLLSITSDFHDTQPVTFTTEPVTFVQKAVTESHTNYHKQPIELPEEQPNIHAPEKSAQPEKSKQVKKTKSVKTGLPENFEISNQVQTWADQKGFDRLDQHLENFLLVCEAKGYQYANWDAAFKTAIRDDWAKLRTSRFQNTGYQSPKKDINADYWASFGQPRQQQDWGEPIDITPKKPNWIEGVGHA